MQTILRVKQLSAGAQLSRQSFFELTRVGWRSISYIFGWGKKRKKKLCRGYAQETPQHINLGIRMGIARFQISGRKHVMKYRPLESFVSFRVVIVSHEIPQWRWWKMMAYCWFPVKIEQLSCILLGHFEQCDSIVDHAQDPGVEILLQWRNCFDPLPVCWNRRRSRARTLGTNSDGPQNFRWNKRRP